MALPRDEGFSSVEQGITTARIQEASSLEGLSKPHG